MFTQSTSDNRRDTLLLRMKKATGKDGMTFLRKPVVVGQDYFGYEEEFICRRIETAGETDFFLGRDRNGNNVYSFDVSDEDLERILESLIN